ncbi:MAG: peptide-methionine (S)-S-oxide reductase, partial [Acetobacteraceae bacterium]
MSRPPTRRALWRYGAGALLAVGIGVSLTRLPARAEQSVQRLPGPALDATAGEGGAQTAVLSGGCFWGVQGVFEHVRGITKVLSGYAGGSATTAQYETVSTGVTGHAESVRITFDPKQVSYGQLLQIFFSVAMDPTELN